MKTSSTAKRAATGQDIDTPASPLSDLHPDEYQALVAEAAYFLAERRGFAPGCELDDWLAAEADIRQRLSED